MEMLTGKRKRGEAEVWSDEKVKVVPKLPHVSSRGM